MAEKKLPPPANGKSYTMEEMIRYGILKPGGESKHTRVKVPSQKVKPVGLSSSWWN